MSADLDELRAAYRKRLDEWRNDFRQRRLNAGINQERIAELAGLSQQGVSHAECGLSNPLPATIRKMEAALAAELAIQEAKS